MYPPSMGLRLAQERQVQIRQTASPTQGGGTGRTGRMSTRLGRLLRLRSQGPSRPPVEAQAQPVLASTRS